MGMWDVGWLAGKSTHHGESDAEGAISSMRRSVMIDGNHILALRSLRSATLYLRMEQKACIVVDGNQIKQMVLWKIQTRTRA